MNLFFFFRGFKTSPRDFLSQQYPVATSDPLGRKGTISFLVDNFWWGTNQKGKKALRIHSAGSLFLWNIVPAISSTMKRAFLYIEAAEGHITTTIVFRDQSSQMLRRYIPGCQGTDLAAW